MCLHAHLYQWLLCLRMHVQVYSRCAYVYCMVCQNVSYLLPEPSAGHLASVGHRPGQVHPGWTAAWRFFGLSGLGFHALLGDYGYRIPACGSCCFSTLFTSLGIRSLLFRVEGQFWVTLDISRTKCSCTSTPVESHT